MEKLNITVQGDTEVLEIVKREGVALPLREPITVHIVGEIDAPLRYAKQLIEKEGANPNLMVVTHKRKEGCIRLNTNRNNHFHDVIEGKVLINPDLTTFDINSERMYTQGELKSIIRLSRRFFRSRDEYEKLLGGLHEFIAKASIEVEAKDDRKGNVKNSYSKQSIVNITLSFTLDMPVHSGGESKTFLVEILADVTDGSVRFWLESADLIDIIEDEKSSIVTENLVGLSELGIPVINLP